MIVPGVKFFDLQIGVFPTASGMFAFFASTVAALQTTFGLRVGFRSEADVLDMMQKDVLAMERRGYRVVSSDEFALPVFLAPGERANYYQVTYELTDPKTHQ